MNIIADKEESISLAHCDRIVNWLSTQVRHNSPHKLQAHLSDRTRRRRAMSK